MTWDIYGLINRSGILEDIVVESWLTSKLFKINDNFVTSINFHELKFLNPLRTSETKKS